MKKKTFILMILCLLGRTIQAQSQDGDSLYNLPIVHEIYFSFPYNSFYDTLISHHAADVYTMCNMVLDGITFDSVGVKFKGNSSFNNPSQKKSIKVDLNEYVVGQDFDDIKKFNLNNGFKDPSFLREKLALDFMNDMGIPAPRCSYSKVYFNNQYWGLYTVVEEVNKKFLGQRFLENDSNLYKGDPHGDLKWLGATVSTYYSHYELETNETTSNDWRGLVHLIDKINNTPTVQFYDSLESVLNTDNFIPQWAATNLFVNLDSYIGSGHNYYLYHNALSNKFEWVCWDVNEAFGNFKMNYTTPQLKNYSLFTTGNPNTRPIIEKMVANPVYKQRLADAACNMLNTEFIYTKLSAKIDSIVAIIRPFVYADTKKSYTNQQFEDNIIMDISTTGPGGGGQVFGIKPFIQSRIQWLEQELLPYGCSITANEKALLSQAQIAPNPIQNVVKITHIESLFPQGCHFACFDINGRLCGELVCNANIEWDASSLPKGVYIAKLWDEKQSIVLRFIK